MLFPKSTHHVNISYGSLNLSFGDWRYVEKETILLYKVIVKEEMTHLKHETEVCLRLR